MCPVCDDSTKKNMNINILLDTGQTECPVV